MYNGGSLIVQEGAVMNVNNDIYTNHHDTVRVEGTANFANSDLNGVYGWRPLVHFYYDTETTVEGISSDNIGYHVNIENQDQVSDRISEFEGNSWNYANVFLQIHDDVTLWRDLYIPENGVVHLENNVTVFLTGGHTIENRGELYVWEGSTLYNEGTIEDHGGIWVHGTLYNYSDLYVREGDDERGGGYLGVMGYLDNESENGRVVVEHGATVYAEGRWTGKDPENRGGDVCGPTLSLTQAQLQQAMASDPNFILDKAAYVTSAMIVNQHLTVGGNGMLFVQPGANLIINGSLNLWEGADLIVDEGATLTNNGYIWSNTDEEHFGSLSVYGNYVHGTNASIKVHQNCGTPTVWGIDERYLTAWYEYQVTDEDVVEATMLEGYASIEVIVDDMSLYSDITIPANMSLIINPSNNRLNNGARDEHTYFYGNVEIEGMMWINSLWNGSRSIPCSLVNDGNITVKDGGVLNISGHMENNGHVYANFGSYVNNYQNEFGAHWYGDYIEFVGFIPQSELERRLAEGYYESELLDVAVVLEQNMTLTQTLNIGSEGQLVVPRGVTLTINENVMLELFLNGKITVEQGGRVVNNGSISIYDEAIFLNSGTLTQGSKGMFLRYDANADGFDGNVKGVANNLQTLLNNQVGYEENLRELLYLLKNGGYKAMDVRAEDLELNNDLEIPANVTLRVGNLRNNAKLTVNGYLEALEGNIQNNGDIIVARNGVLEVNSFSYNGKAPVNNGGQLRPYTESVSIQGDEVVEVKTHEESSVTLWLDVAPYEALNFVKWTSSNTSLVNPNNIVDNGDGSYTVNFAKNAVGTVKLTATSIDGKNHSDTVTLNLCYVDSAARLTAKIVGYDAAAGLQGGQKAQIEVYGSDPETPLNPEHLTFSVIGLANTVNIDENGMITALNQNATVFITAAIKDDPLRRSAMLILRTVPLQPESLTLSINGEEDEIVLDKYDLKSAEARNIRIEPRMYFNAEYAANLAELGITPTANITWFSSSFLLATVTGQKDGTGLMTIRDGVSGSFTVTGKIGTQLVDDIKVTVKDYEPKLTTARLSLNSKMYTGAAVDFTSEGSDIRNVTLVKAADWFNKDYRNSLEVTGAYDNWAVKAVGDTEIPNGSINLTLRVDYVTETGEARFFDKDITMQVLNTEPFVNVFQSGVLNLFYINDGAELTISAMNATVQRVEVVGTKTELTPTSNGKYLLDRDSVNGAAGNRLDLNVYLKDYRNPIKRTHFISSYTLKPYLTMSASFSTLNTEYSDDLTTKFQLKLGQEILNLADVEIKSLSSKIASVAKNGNTVELTLNPETGLKGGRVKLEVWNKENWKEPIEVYHQITVQTMKPLVMLRSPMLSLNRIFTKQTGETLVTVSHPNVELSGIEFNPGIGANVTETQKIDLSYDKNTDKIVVRITDPKEPPKAGIYMFRGTPYVHVDGEKKLLNDVTVMVNVTATAPIVMLTGGAVRLNSYLAGGEKVASNFQIFNGNDCKIIGYKVVDGAESFIVDVNHSYTHDGTVELGIENGKLTARLISDDKTAKNYILKIQPIVYSETWDQMAVLDTQLMVMVQVYYSEQISVTALAGGNLSAAKPETGVTYTVYFMMNAACGLDDVEVVGAAAELFETVMTGEKTFELRIREGVKLNAYTIHNVQLQYSVGGKTLAPVTVSVFVL